MRRGVAGKAFVAAGAAFIAAGAFAIAQPLAAQERILSYDTEIDVRADGSIEVAEHIRVRAEGSEIRRGIYRDIPTRYRDRFGNRVRADIEVLGVERNDAPEAWFTEARSNGVRINTGGDDFLPALPADYTFTIRYRATRQLGYFDEHDELYWNAIGTGFIFAIESGSVVVRLPAAVPAEQLGAEGYTGPQGARGTAYTAVAAPDGTAHYRLTQRLDPYHGFTIVLTFPKGLVPEPTRAQRRAWFLADNAGVLVALLGLLGMLLFCAVAWWRVGRDPRRGVIVPRYEPPAQHTPAALRFVQRMNYDMRCFSADLLGLAVAGHVHIHRDKQRFSEKWRVERRGPAATAAAASLFARSRGMAPGGADAVDAAAAATDGAAAGADDANGAVTPPAPLQRSLLDGLFAGGTAALELDNKNAKIVAGARDAHRRALDKELHPRYFERHTRMVWYCLAIIVATLVVASVASGGNGLPVILLLVFVMIVVSTVFARLVRAPTAEGRRLLDEIEGLRLYLSVAERDDLARVQAPGSAPRVDAERYEALLPYAVALQVEDAWTKKFTAAAGAAAVAAATQRMGWYTGTGRVGDFGDFSRAIGTSLSSSIASASTPPGSSSGSSGGGSSGGGGGGGGGGGR